MTTMATTCPHIRLRWVAATNGHVRRTRAAPSTARGACCAIETFHLSLAPSCDWTATAALHNCYKSPCFRGRIPGDRGPGSGPRRGWGGLRRGARGRGRPRRPRPRRDSLWTRRESAYTPPAGLTPGHPGKHSERGSAQTGGMNLIRRTLLDAGGNNVRRTCPESALERNRTRPHDAEKRRTEPEHRSVRRFWQASGVAGCQGRRWRPWQRLDATSAAGCAGRTA